MATQQKGVPFVPIPCSHSRMPRETGLCFHIAHHRKSLPCALCPREGEVEIVVAYSIAEFAQVQQPLSLQTLLPAISFCPCTRNNLCLSPQSWLVLALKTLFSSVYSFVMFSPPYCFKAEIVQTMSVSWCLLKCSPPGCFLKVSC